MTAVAPRTRGYLATAATYENLPSETGRFGLVTFDFDPEGRWFGVERDWTIWWEGTSYYIKHIAQKVFLPSETRPNAVDFAIKKTEFLFPKPELEKPFLLHVAPHDETESTVLKRVVQWTPKGKFITTWRSPKRPA